MRLELEYGSSPWSNWFSPKKNTWKRNIDRIFWTIIRQIWWNVDRIRTLIHQIRQIYTIKIWWIRLGVQFKQYDNLDMYWSNFGSIVIQFRTRWVQISLECVHDHIKHQILTEKVPLKWVKQITRSQISDNIHLPLKQPQSFQLPSRGGKNLQN